MNKKYFKDYVKTMVNEFGVRSYLDNIDEDMTQEEIDDDLWFECPICGEPILYDDYADSELLFDDICPICEQNFYEG